MRIITTILVVLIAQFAVGQIDKDKMDRDIEVAENILSTLSRPNDGSDNLTFYGQGMYEGSYVEGYGVIFNSSRRFSTVMIRKAPKMRKARGYTYSSSGSSVIIASDESDSDFDVDSLKAAVQGDWVEQMKTFYTDYAHLIGQLDDDDKIMITNGPSVFTAGRNEFHFRNNEEQTKIEAQFKDIKDYQSGKLSKAKFLDKIAINISVPKDVDKDIQLLANIFQTLYKRDISDTYYISGNIYPEKLSGLGAILKMKVYSSVYEGDLHRLVTRNKSGLTQEERDSEVKEMYPKFIESLKSNLVSYGRTVKSLKSDERLILRVDLTRCKDCNIPETVELSVSASELSAYNEGKISEEQATRKINLEEIGNQ